VYRALLDTCALVPGRLLILNSITLAKRWRGYGIGALLAGEAILAP
jgi:hypothetical protein